MNATPTRPGWWSPRRWRYALIRALVGQMPVVMNVVVRRPPGFRGELFHFDMTRPGMFTGNVQVDALPRMPLLASVRDYLSSPKKGAKS